MGVVLAKRLGHIKPSATFAMTAKAHKLSSEGHDVINLSVGEPSHDTPLNIKAAGIQAIHDGYTRYTAVQGIKPLRQAICQHLHRQYHLSYQPDEIMVSNGAKHSITNALFALLSPGDEVLIPTPYWVSYPEMVRLAGGEPKFIPCDQSSRFLLTPELLERFITKKSKILFLNSPSNPSGMCYNASELSRLADILINYPQLMIISDDIYAQLNWQEGGFHNLTMVNEAFKERTVLINGVSKAYAMTGWRIGFAAGPKALIKGMTIIQSQMTSCPSSISQMAAVEAMETGLHPDVLRSFKENHQLLYQGLNQFKSIEVTPADGALYLFPNMSKVIKKLKLKDDFELADYLLEHLHISVVPGSAFGAPMHIRMTFSIDQLKLKKGLQRIQEWMQTVDA
jgi:aspartate aminotransferase